MTTPDRDFQLNLEKLFAKNQLISRIKQEFKAEPDFEKQMALASIPYDFGLTLLAQMVVHKRATVPELVGLLKYHFADSEYPAQECADYLYACAQLDLVDYNEALGQFIIRWTISPDVQKEIDMYQYPLPMVIKPMHIKDNRTTGYLNIGGSVILKDNHHDHDVCLDHLNMMNSIPLKINETVMRTSTDKWRNHNMRKPGESLKDFRKRMKAFNVFNTTSQDVMDALIEAGNKFYLTHKYDKRGRSYCCGYHINYQGTDYRKAVISLANEEVVPLV